VIPRLVFMMALLSPALLAAEPLTLQAALDMAEQRNPELAAARSLQVAAEADAQGASRVMWPRLGVSADLMRTDNPALAFAQKLNRGEFTDADFAVDRLNDPDALGHLSTALSLEVPIDLGRARAGSHAARAQARAAAAGTSEARLQLRLQVVEAYRQAAVARRAVEATAPRRTWRRPG
jgi:outer membrane protein TolC